MPSFARLQGHMGMPGAWFCVPERVAMVAMHYDPESPRRIILCESPLLDVTVRALFRSTTRSSRWPLHLKHDANEHPVSCKIDEDGWIHPDEVRDIPVAELVDPDRYSCQELDENVIERVMSVGPRRRRRR